jgi:YVTN family beta-propeller protein
VDSKQAVVEAAMTLACAALAALWVASAAFGAGVLQPLPGMPPLVDPGNLYSETRAGAFNPVAAAALNRVYVPNRRSNNIYVIDAATGAVKKIKVGMQPHGLTVWPQPGRYSLGHTGNLR